jgi:hypothetical protein
MKTIVMAICGAALLIPAALAQDANPKTGNDQVMHEHHPTEDSAGTAGVITGYVRDVACLLRNSKAGAATTPLTQDCLQRCVRSGSPIGILTEEGALYLPISDATPDTSARRQLLPYAGKYIKANGKLFERGGLHAISIEKIEVISRPADSRIPTS